MNKEQMRALMEFATVHGRGWKAALLDLWMTGKDASQPNGHLLRQLRNTLGPEGLKKI